MNREALFALLEDASEERLERLENNNMLTRNLYLESDEIREEYVLTDPGREYFDI